eukprot:scpid88865/ scgid19056/ 
MPAHISSIAIDNVHELLRVDGKINGRRATMLIDSGFTHDFISQSFVERHQFSTASSTEPLNVALADGTSSSRPMVTVGPVKLVVKNFGEDQHFTVFPLVNYDAILGKPWLTCNNPNIDFRTNQVHVKSETVVAKASHPSITSSSDKPIESLFISGSQASHALRAGAQGYLAWVSIMDDNSSDVDQGTTLQRP